MIKINRAFAALLASARDRWLLKLKLRRKRHIVRLANIAEGTHDGNITKAVDAIITERHLLAKIGSASDRIAVCGSADTPIGVITDEAPAIGDWVNLALLGSSRSTLRMVAAAAITQGALLEPAASGRVQTLGAGAGTHHVVGRALDSATAAGEVIEVDPLYFLRVI
ncbi:MAG: capsid cement protein [Verrucomicrobiota bacterium]|nr:capsid cement protein [Verrucomicrobiota bacterium]